MKYMISYDLESPDKDYEVLYDELKKIKCSTCAGFSMVG